MDIRFILANIEYCVRISDLDESLQLIFFPHKYSWETNNPDIDQEIETAFGDKEKSRIWKMSAEKTLRSLKDVQSKKLINLLLISVT